MKSSQVCQKWQAGIDNLCFLSLRSDRLNVTNEKTNAMLLFVEAEQRIDHFFPPRKHQVKILYFEDQRNNSSDIWQGETSRLLLLLMYICFNIWHRQGQRALTVSSTKVFCSHSGYMSFSEISSDTRDFVGDINNKCRWRFIFFILGIYPSFSSAKSTESDYRINCCNHHAFWEGHGWVIRNSKAVQINYQ